MFNRALVYPVQELAHFFATQFFERNTISPLTPFSERRVVLIASRPCPIIAADVLHDGCCERRWHGKPQWSPVLAPMQVPSDPRHELRRLLKIAFRPFSDVEFRRTEMCTTLELSLARRGSNAT